jgi:hypothetical protein
VLRADGFLQLVFPFTFAPEQRGNILAADEERPPARIDLLHINALDDAAG